MCELVVLIYIVAHYGIKPTQVDNTIQYGEDADVRTHDFEQNEDGFDADRLLGEGG